MNAFYGFPLSYKKKRVRVTARAECATFSNTMQKHGNIIATFAACPGQKRQCMTFGAL
jgi:hypothetical protein